MDIVECEAEDFVDIVSPVAKQLVPTITDHFDFAIRCKVLQQAVVVTGASASNSSFDEKLYKLCFRRELFEKDNNSSNKNWTIKVEVGRGPWLRTQPRHVVGTIRLNIPDNEVSSTHCTISSIGPESWTITDIGSLNGTEVNGNHSTPFKASKLQVNDTIKLGNSCILSIERCECPLRDKVSDNSSAKAVKQPNLTSREQHNPAKSKFPIRSKCATVKGATKKRKPSKKKKTFPDSVAEIEKRIRAVDDDITILQQLRDDLVLHLQKTKSLQNQKRDFLDQGPDSQEGIDQSDRIDLMTKSLFDSCSQPVETNDTVPKNALEPSILPRRSSDVCINIDTSDSELEANPSERCIEDVSIHDSFGDAENGSRLWTIAGATSIDVNDKNQENSNPNVITREPLSKKPASTNAKRVVTDMEMVMALANSDTNEKLYEDILLSRVVHLETLQKAMMDELGKRVSLERLMKFLDEQGVTYKVQKSKAN
mmetsp:Transcript_11572/g.15009  ORF Transcript_11572/g.15009 Transcript_11572/m.15009 type:complete len:482 (+) Transcript_11572:195-1640(+)